jgi:hypothetical protein
MKKEYTPKDDGKLCTKLKTYLFCQTEFKTMLEICRAIGEPDCRVGTIASRFRDLVYLGYVPSYDSKEVDGRKLQTYRLGKPLFTNGLLFEEFQQHVEDYTHPDNR